MKYRVIQTKKKQKKQNKKKQKQKKKQNKTKKQNKKIYIYIFKQDNPVGVMTLVSMGVL